LVGPLGTGFNFYGTGKFFMSMKSNEEPIFIKGAGKLPLVTDSGRDYLGLAKSSSPELSERAVAMFERLDGLVGFPGSVEGKQNQKIFNLILRYAYPELMIDLADLIYVQHERPMVFLNFDHINMNLQTDTEPVDVGETIITLNSKMEFLFLELASTLKNDQSLCNDTEVVRLLSESYSHYLYLTENFPWEDPLKETIPPGDLPALDIASGLAGYSLIFDWPDDHPRLVLTDSMPFIVEGLNHYKNLIGKTNVEIVKVDFPDANAITTKFGSIHSTKFLHHLKQSDRQSFLKWVFDQLEPGGILRIVDTDLEYQILMEAIDPEYKEKLMPGFLETLVDVGDDFCGKLMEDVKASGFNLMDHEVGDYHDETDAFSHYPGENLSLKFRGVEIVAEKK
jgi:hypothetical protein